MSSPLISHAAESLSFKASRGLNIALVFRLRPNKFGSLEQWILKFCRDARARGHRIDLYTSDGILPELLSELNAIGVCWRSLTALNKNSYTLWRAFLRADIVHLNFVSLRERIALLSYLSPNSKIIWVDHNSCEIGAREINGLRQFLDSVILRRISRVVCVSEYVKKRAASRFKNSSTENLRVERVYNGVDIDRFSPVVRSPSSEFRILSVAHLIYEKGIDVLLEAVSRLQNVNYQLTIVGTGKEELALRLKISDLGIAHRVTFLGLRSDVSDILKKYDVFVHPARWHEAFGLTIAESMASGVPTIASDVGGIPELIEHGESGLLVPAENSEKLAEALYRLATDEVLYRRCALKGRERAVERFSLDSCVKRHLEVCEHV